MIDEGGVMGAATAVRDERWSCGRGWGFGNSLEINDHAAITPLLHHFDDPDEQKTGESQDSPKYAIGRSLRNRAYKVVCRNFLGDRHHLDVRRLFMVYTDSLHILTIAFEAGQHCLPVALYGQGMVLTLRI
jgi:hypothetical protein